LDEFSFCPHCGERKIAERACPACGNESADDFTFCPYCGKAFLTIPSESESQATPPEIEQVTDTETDQTAPTQSGAAGRSNKVGTYVFLAFAAISLLVSIIKGVVPIYLLESAGWAGAAWYWHRKKTHGELAKAVVIVLAALLAIGEVIHIASQADSHARQVAATRPYYGEGQPASQYPATSQSPATAPLGTSSTPDLTEIEQEATALYKQRRYSEARPLFDQACNGGEMSACSYLGYLYAQGLGGARDTKKAREVYEKACDNGTLSSCASLGSIYHDAGNSDSARKYFRKACNGGVTEACNLLRELQ